MKKLIFSLFILITLNACKGKSEHFAVSDIVLTPPSQKQKMAYEEEKVSIVDDYGDQAEKVGSGTRIADTSKKITKEGTVEFETRNIDATRKQILALLKRNGGYADEDNQSLNSARERKECILKLRIPVRNFDFVVDSALLTADKIDSKNISVTDVTTSYIDTKTRLINKQDVEKRYQELLAKAAKVSDILEIQDKLADVRTEIESTQGQLNYLNKQIAYISLSVTFYTPLKSNEPGYNAGYKFGKAFGDGWQSLQDFFFSLIAAWPFILIIVVIILLLRRWRKRRAARRAS